MIAKFCYLIIIIFLVLIPQRDGESLHGGTFLALAGKDSVLLASDTRFSSPNTGPYLIGQHERFVFRVGKYCVVGCFGLDSDAREVYEYVRDKVSNLQESDNIGPDGVARLISNYLYDTQLYCTPVVVGLKLAKNSPDEHVMRPYICSMDGLGAMTLSEGFAVIGTASSSIYSLCEAQYKPDLSSEQLMTVAEKVLKLALQRDVLSGCQVNVVTLTKDGIFMKDFETFDV